MAVAAALWVMGSAAGFAADSPHMGTWTLDEAKSDIPAGMAKNTTVVYTEEGDKWKITTEGKDKDGKPSKTTWMGKIDGKPYAVEGSSAFDQIAYTKKDDRTNELKTMKDGKVMATGNITVAEDGKTRVVTVTMTGEDGKKKTGKSAYNKG
ncbi:MAG: hypothetical protein ABIR71_07670 [Chthoniobacterales bacterium]